MGNYYIQVIDENGRTSIIETGISRWLKESYFDETLNYYRNCNPTKQFELKQS